MKNSQFIFTGIGSAVAFVTVFSLVLSGRYESIDTSLFGAINSLSSNAAVSISAVALTDLGNYITEGVIAVLVYFVSKPNRKVAIGVIAAIVVSNVVVLLLDSVYFRPRPYQALGNVYLPVGKDQSPSFPSGHSTRAFAIASVIAVLKGRKFVPAFVVAGAIALSRILVGVHFPSDVIGGAFLGISLGLSALYLTEALRLVRVAERVVPIQTR